MFDATQHVSAIAGFAYGAIGADVHVHGDGSPLYLLEEHRSRPGPDPDWLRQAPSRMLNAHTRLVPFIGRTAELDEARRWLSSRARLAVHWMQGPGGQGKTRLAKHVADLAAADGWRVVSATHGVGAVQPPASAQDLRTDDHHGVLLIVDYADRWTLTALTWLLRNALLHRPHVPARVLLLARSSTNWPGLRGMLQSPELRASLSSSRLTGLTGHDRDGRWAMFAAAREAFAGIYGLPDTSAVTPPAGLDAEQFSLILAVHVAALVAVDAHATGTTPADDPAALSEYLLDRERSHWALLYEEGRHRGLDYATPPVLMSRTVFTSSLTGRLHRETGSALLRWLEPGTTTERILADHRYCYPPLAANGAEAPDFVLEPLYPDRLAEDFIALCLRDGDTAAWAGGRLGQLVPADVQPSSPYAGRAVTFLTAAAARWPLLGRQRLYPLVRRSPESALAAGSATLSALAGLIEIDIETLEAIEARIPKHGNVDLDDGLAAVSVALTHRRVETEQDPATRGSLRLKNAERLARAGRMGEALKAAGDAVIDFNSVQDPDTTAQGHLGEALTIVGGALTTTGRCHEALEPLERAEGILRAVASTDVGWLLSLSMTINNLGITLAQLGRQDDALKMHRSGVELNRRLVSAAPEISLIDLGTSLTNLVARLAELGRYDEALPAAVEAVEILRGLVHDEPAHLPALNTALTNAGVTHAGLRQWQEALACAEESLSISARMAEINPVAYTPDLATAQHNLSARRSEVHRFTDALAAVDEAIGIRRRLVRDNPVDFAWLLATSLAARSGYLGAIGRGAEAVVDAAEAVEITRGLAETNPPGHLPGLGSTLTTYASALSSRGRHAEALDAAEEAEHILRRCAEVEPVAHRTALATALQRRAAALVGLGRPQAALEPAAEALRTYEGLAELNPVAHLDRLVPALNHVGLALWNCGRRNEAIPPAARAVEISRRLVAERQDAYLPALATALNNLAVRLAETGSRTEALAPAQEAQRLCEQLERENSGVHTADLAMTTLNLALRLAWAGRVTDARVYAQRAVQLYRQLVAANPDRHRHDLADALSNLGVMLTDQHECGLALTTTTEAVALYRELARRDVAAHQHRLAETLINLGRCHAAAGRRAEALDCVEEAVRLVAPLVEQHPATHEYLHAAAVDALGLRLAEAERPDDALPVARTAVTLFRGLVERNQSAYLPDYAVTLTNLAATLLDVNQPDEAISVATEAANILRRLATGNPATYSTPLGISMNNLYVALARSERIDEALTAAQKSVAAFRVAMTNSSVHAPTLLNDLVAVAGMSVDQNRDLPGATAALHEALDVYAGLSTPHPDSARLRSVGGMVFRALVAEGRVVDAMRLRDHFAAVIVA
ncbi:tetratricopeptide repeat protein [Micromonospora sp. NPDC005806]|uniref:tetratricopeptide repeat protein n=1 Tax=Micromonospora sp. NPDC005806 TaxID=3364234 RepID=UPI0036BA55D1